MRSLAFIVSAFLLAATPSFAGPVVQVQDTARSDVQPRGDRWEDRWQGRHHWLYDDAIQQSATDGQASNAQASCRTVAVRVKRSDGAFAIRHHKLCD